jgi:hypothetical protein
MVIFHSYVSLPEGIQRVGFGVGLISTEDAQMTRDQMDAAWWQGISAVETTVTRI